MLGLESELATMGKKLASFGNELQEVQAQVMNGISRIETEVLQRDLQDQMSSGLDTVRGEFASDLERQNKAMADSIAMLENQTEEDETQIQELRTGLYEQKQVIERQKEEHDRGYDMASHVQNVTLSDLNLLKQNFQAMRLELDNLWKMIHGQQGRRLG